MRHLAVHRYLHLQAAVVRRDHLVTEAGGDHQIRVNDLVLEQPGRADLAAELLVVGKEQLHATVSRSGHGFERPHRKGVGGEVALAHGRRTPIDGAVFDFAAVRVLRPAVTRRDHVAMRIQQHGAPRAVLAAHHQVGDRFHPAGTDLGFRNRILFGLQPHGLQQCGSALGVWCVVARWRVSGHADQLLQKAHLFVKVGIDPGVERGVVLHGGFSLLRRVGSAGWRKPRWPVACRRWWWTPAGCG